MKTTIIIILEKLQHLICIRAVPKLGGILEAGEEAMMIMAMIYIFKNTMTVAQ